MIIDERMCERCGYQYHTTARLCGRVTMSKYQHGQFRALYARDLCGGCTRKLLKWLEEEAGEADGEGPSSA